MGAHTQLQCCTDRYQNASKCCAKLYSQAATAGGIEMPNRKCISSCSLRKYPSEREETQDTYSRRKGEKESGGRDWTGWDLCSHGCVEFVLQTECRSVERNMIIKAHKVQRSKKRANRMQHWGTTVSVYSTNVKRYWTGSHWINPQFISHQIQFIKCAF